MPYRIIIYLYVALNGEQKPGYQQVRVLWEFTQAITVSINLLLKCVAVANAKDHLKQNAKVIIIPKNKLQHVKMQTLNGASLSS